jgi:hypothetical protein
MDLPATELRGLMDLRNRPRSFIQASETAQIVRPAPHQTDLLQPTVSNPASRDDGQPIIAH